MFSTFVIFHTPFSTEQVAPSQSCERLIDDSGVLVIYSVPPLHSTTMECVSPERLVDFAISQSVENSPRVSAFFESFVTFFTPVYFSGFENKIVLILSISDRIS
jgi:hypothetical protein